MEIQPSKCAACDMHACCAAGVALHRAWTEPDRVDDFARLARAGPGSGAAPQRVPGADIGDAATRQNCVCCRRACSKVASRLPSRSRPMKSPRCRSVLTKAALLPGLRQLQLLSIRENSLLVTIEPQVPSGCDARSEQCPVLTQHVLPPGLRWPVQPPGPLLR
eukprot:756081-Rhodomonas_salina.4